MITRRPIAAIAICFVVSAAMADVIVMKTGEQIEGTVTRFERNEHAISSSRFVIETDGEERQIPLFKIDTVTFDRTAESVPADKPQPLPGTRRTPAPPQRPLATRPRVTEEDSEGGEYWLSSTGKRHNSSCRYYKSSKGRPCGAKDGVACKTCGG